MSTIQKYWRKQAKAIDYGGPRQHVVIPLVECADGFTMSVQASADHYCTPRRTLLKDGSYTTWEVGFPSKMARTLLPYRERTGEKATESIYSSVPTDVVDALIAKHGGLKE